MRRLILRWFLLGWFLSVSAYGQYTSDDVWAYIEKWAPIAMEEMKRTGIPASIKLAQGILESGAGKSMLAVKANNHFGIKCHGWQGAKIYKDDDAKNECFRKYKSAVQSFRDHSEFLTTRKRYAFLFELDPLDYKAWAHGLKKAGYATNPKYAHKLIAIIEKYGLAKYDTMVVYGKDYYSRPKQDADKEKQGIEKQENVSSQAQWQKVYINQLKAVRLTGSVNWEGIAREFGISVHRLKMYNDNLPDSVVDRAGIVYLQPKRKKSLVAERYKVRKGETLALISQKTGVRLEWLRKRNLLGECEEPMAGEWVVLRGHRVRPPRSKPCISEPEKQIQTTHVQNSYPTHYADIDEEFLHKPTDSDFNKTEVTADSLIAETQEQEKFKGSGKKEIIHSDENPSHLYVPRKRENLKVVHSVKSEQKHKIHIVKQGETLYRISRQYGVTIEDIMKVNKLRSTTIYVGQRLIIPNVSRETSQ